MQSQPAPQNTPTGIAFEIADLLLLRGWGDYHDMQMVVELDHFVEGEEYEEVVAFYARDSRLRRWIIWRAPERADTIVVQPLIGRSARFATVAEALERLIPARS
jgi:hypothetical protein